MRDGVFHASGRHPPTCDVTGVGTCAEGYLAAKANRFDVYMIDNRLPDGIGIDLCRQIRAFDQKTPIIFCSGFTDDSHRRTAMNAGANLFLAKPFDFDRLIGGLQIRLKMLRARGIYIAPDRNQYVVVSGPDDMFFLFTIRNWRRHGEVGLRVNHDKTISNHGVATGWSVDDLIDTGRTANEISR